MDELSRLALEAKAGDEAALIGLVRRTQADVWRFAAHLVDRGSADDLTQEVYLRAIPALARYRAEAPVRVWLLSIARRVCADELRRRIRRRARIGEPTTLDEVAEPAEADASGAADLAGLVGDLDADRRAAFVLTQLLGLAYDEAATVCGVRIGTIRSRVARARAELIAAAVAADTA